MLNSYRVKTAFTGLKRLATLSAEDKQACIDAYRYFQRMQAGEPTETAEETKAVADYYKVLNNMLSVFDLEKLYIPPMLDETKGLYDNQIMTETAVLAELHLEDPAGSHLLDMGCGRGRIAHHFATLTDGQVSGYNIDPDQVENGIDWAARCGIPCGTRPDSCRALGHRRTRFAFREVDPARRYCWPKAEHTYHSAKTRRC